MDIAPFLGSWIYAELRTNPVALPGEASQRERVRQAPYDFYGWELAGLSGKVPGERVDLALRARCGRRAEPRRQC
jgi:hypothetical protein